MQTLGFLWQHLFSKHVLQYTYIEIHQTSYYSNNYYQMQNKAHTLTVHITKILGPDYLCISSTTVYTIFFNESLHHTV